MSPIIEIFDDSLMITGFVFVMLLVIEYINVLTNGTWQQQMMRSQWLQYVLAAFLGATPGCLGAFAVVAMYSHQVVSLGAVVAAMIATSGDESFIMLTTIPKDMFLLSGVLFLGGILFGILTDLVSNRLKGMKPEACEELTIHTFEDCQCYPRGQIFAQWKSLSPFRTILSLALFLFIIFVMTGQLGPSDWNWVRISLLVAGSMALFIAATVPDHFLQEHLWNHVVQKHVPRVFLWTLGTLIVIRVLTEQLNLEGMIQNNLWAVLGIASLVGLIPESGPHLIFVMLFAKGTIPFSILLASSIVQDGHGMLPMLAHSRKAFVTVKLVNFGVGVSMGAIVLALGG
jgi:Putative, 10TM heavy-metal exporter